MIKKVLNVFLACLFACVFTIETANAEPIYTPSSKSIEYLSMGWVVQPTWMGDHWFIHAYDPEDAIGRWDDYEE